MGFGVINLIHCNIDNKGRLMCPSKRGFMRAFSNYDLNNNVFVVGGHRYCGRKELIENFDESVVNEMVSYIKTSLAIFEV